MRLICNQAPHFPQYRGRAGGGEVAVEVCNEGEIPGICVIKAKMVVHVKHNRLLGKQPQFYQLAVPAG